MVWLHRNMSELFKVNCNVNFKIVFKTIQLCISWWIKNFANMKMLHGTNLKKKRKQESQLKLSFCKKLNAKKCLETGVFI
jgi:hypothetical protein